MPNDVEKFTMMISRIFLLLVFHMKRNLFNSNDAIESFTCLKLRGGNIVQFTLNMAKTI